MTDPKAPVSIASYGTLMEAELACERLHAEGIDAFVPGAQATNALAHVQVMLNPNGIEVLVPTDRAEEAVKLLQSRRNTSHSDQMPENAPDRWAGRAAISAAVIILVPPILFWSIYCTIRAEMARRRQPVADPRCFKKNLSAAIMLQIFFALIGLAVIVKYVFYPK
jgi:hypothetical protein